MIYLSCPYTHPDERTRTERMNKAMLTLMVCTARGVNVYSPLQHFASCADVDVAVPMLYRHGVDMVGRCDGLAVLELDGWDDSKGVRMEMAAAREKGIPIIGIRFKPHPDRVAAASTAMADELGDFADHCDALQ